jgi:hypothetical protein
MFRSLAPRGRRVNRSDILRAGGTGHIERLDHATVHARSGPVHMQDDPTIRAFSIGELLKLAPIGRSTL